MIGQYGLFAVFASALFTQVAYAKPPQKIVNGELAVAGEFPFIVSLRLDGEHICGGSIVTDRHILTAAHCVANIPVFNNLHVVTGSIYISSGGQSHRPTAILYHEDYTHTVTGPHDVAILALGSPIRYNRWQSAAIAPTSPPTSGLQAVVAGWGYTSLNRQVPVDRLRKLTGMYTLTAEDCQPYSPNERIYPYQLCASAGKGRGPCHTDSGGPLSINGVLIGVVSWGKPCAKGAPDVFSNVYYYKDWIRHLSETS